jgi:translocator protein
LCVFRISEPERRRLTPNTGIALVGFVGLCLLVGLSSGAISEGGLAGWYPSLVKPPGTPPPLVFPAIWSTLYCLIGIAAWLVWREGYIRPVRRELRRWGWQLLVNALWTPAFFGLRNPALGLGVMVLLLATVLWTMQGFHRVRPAASWLMLPYLLWVLYAGYMNVGILILNG